MPELFAPQLPIVVPLSAELLRVSQMPRRQWSEREAAELAREMTAILKTPSGSMQLRPLQAIALYEIGTEGGLFGPVRVGGGKTLVSLLAPVCAFEERPLLLVPAKLAGKTERDRRELAEHWQLPRHLRVMTYEWLGRAQAADALEAYLPGMIIGDESHKISNLRAAVTRRLRRFHGEHPDVKFVLMSGTMTKRSLHDYAHLARWALGPEKMFVPRNYQDLEMWADALDERKGQVKRAEPGALEILCDEEELRRWQSDKRGAARSAFRRRMVETPGVVASHETPIDATLTLTGAELLAPLVIEQAFQKLRSDWETPDGWTIADGLGIFQHARELALGLFYRWDPRPPRDWMEARKTWHKFVRQVLKHSRTLDSEKQVALAHPDSEELREWRAIRDSFEPNTVPVWLDDSVLRFCAEWARENRGIVWTEHVHFGERLGRDYGFSYYGRGGLDARGRSIEDHPPREPMVASIQSNSEGRNLQAWSTALITSCPANGKQMEQLLGRLHRDGQQADEVEFDVITTCAEHVGALWQAVSDCRYVQDSTGSPQKLLLAGINALTPDDLVLRRGARWEKDWAGQGPR
jgi:hypothetical protein